MNNLNTTTPEQDSNRTLPEETEPHVTFRELQARGRVHNHSIIATDPNTTLPVLNTNQTRTEVLDQETASHIITRYFQHRIEHEVRRLPHNHNTITIQNDTQEIIRRTVRR